MSAVAPLREETAKVRPSDLRRSPLERRSTARANTVAPVPLDDGENRLRLAVVPRRGRAVGIVATCCVLLFGLLLGAVAFQTKIAQNQLALDKTEREVRDARARYDVLRRQRAELRSPGRLSVEATRLGMAPAENGSFMTISPAVVASVMAAASGLPNDVSNNQESSFDQFGQVKSVSGVVP